MQTTSISRKTAITTAAIIAALALGTTIAVTTATAAPSSSTTVSLPTTAELTARIDAAAPALGNHLATAPAILTSAENEVLRALSIHSGSEGIADEDARADLLTAIDAAKVEVNDAHASHTWLLWLNERLNTDRNSTDDFTLMDLANHLERAEAIPALDFDLTAETSAVIDSLTATLPAPSTVLTDGTLSPEDRLSALATSLPFTVQPIIISDDCGDVHAVAWGCYDMMLNDSPGIIRITNDGLALSDGELRAIIAHEQRHHQQLVSGASRFSFDHLSNIDWLELDAYPFGDRYNPDL